MRVLSCNHLNINVGSLTTNQIQFCVLLICMFFIYGNGTIGRINNICNLSMYGVSSVFLRGYQISVLSKRHICSHRQCRLIAEALMLSIICSQCVCEFMMVISVAYISDKNNTPYTYVAMQNLSPAVGLKKNFWDLNFVCF